MKNLGRYENDLSIPRKKDVDEKYTKPAGGIPKADLSSSVQTSLGKADTALQEAPVTSVNGETGAVVLTQDNVADGTTYVQYSKTEKEKLSNVEAGATKNTITLNGEANQNPEFYAPTTPGNDGEVACSDGYGFYWTTFASMGVAKKFGIGNDGMDAVDGVFTWDIDLTMYGIDKDDIGVPIVNVYKYDERNEGQMYKVLADVFFNEISGLITIKINDVDNVGTISDGNFLASIVY